MFWKNGNDHAKKERFTYFFCKGSYCAKETIGEHFINLREFYFITKQYDGRAELSSVIEVDIGHLQRTEVLLRF